MPQDINEKMCVITNDGKRPDLIKNQKLRTNYCYDVNNKYFALKLRHDLCENCVCRKYNNASIYQ